MSAREPRTIARHRSSGVVRRYPLVVGLLVTLASVPTAAAVLAGSASLTTPSQPRTPFVAGAQQDPVVVPGGDPTGPSVGIARPQSTRTPVSRNHLPRPEDLPIRPIRVVREAGVVPVPDAGSVPVPIVAASPSPVPSPSPSPSPAPSPSLESSPSPGGSPSASPTTSAAGSSTASPAGSPESGDGVVGH